ncbi:hypothetical protein GVN16_09895 [Emticicia sp. CRIBPO]|uniref:hypothetical protein n=1 Tax=Emticicia sp. CRIBPO TaxID=2683258 RepID=UPI001412C91F|nr:hypothetical protein [Emticicia sp. CRIBPO]NBA86074.1 hypothetical protein [Emticicia sp. CRIBPO]
MNSVNVIFDTNVYRNLTFGLSQIETIDLFNRIKEVEISRKISVGLSGITAMELISHLARRDDKGFENCKLATIGAGIHSDHFFPIYKLHLQQLVFGRLDSSDIDAMNGISKLVDQISKNDPEKIINQYSEQIKGIYEIVQLHKSDFISTYHQAVAKVDPTGSNNHIFKQSKQHRIQLLNFLKTPQAVLWLAQGYFDKTIKGRSHNFSQLDAELKISEIARCFKTAFSLHVKLIERIATTGYDMTNNKKNRANTIFDIYQLFCINDETMRGKRSIFVTDDIWLKEAAVDSGFPEKVLDSKTYFKILELEYKSDL